MERTERRQGAATSRVEYVSYESPVLLDTESLARATRAGTCGVCITGGSGAAEELAETAEAEAAQGAGGSKRAGSSVSQ
jgi:hypothetical protein